MYFVDVGWKLKVEETFTFTLIYIHTLHWFISILSNYANPQLSKLLQKTLLQLIDDAQPEDVDERTTNGEGVFSFCAEDRILVIVSFSPFSILIHNFLFNQFPWPMTSESFLSAEYSSLWVHIPHFCVNFHGRKTFIDAGIVSFPSLQLKSCQWC